MTGARKDPAYGAAAAAGALLVELLYEEQAGSIRPALLAEVKKA